MKIFMITLLLFSLGHHFAHAGGYYEACGGRNFIAATSKEHFKLASSGKENAFAELMKERADAICKRLGYDYSLAQGAAEFPGDHLTQEVYLKGAWEKMTVSNIPRGGRPYPILVFQYCHCVVKGSFDAPTSGTSARNPLQSENSQAQNNGPQVSGAKGTGTPQITKEESKEAREERRKREQEELRDLEEKIQELNRQVEIAMKNIANIGSGRYEDRIKANRSYDEIAFKLKQAENRRSELTQLHLEESLDAHGFTKKNPAPQDANNLGEKPWETPSRPPLVAKEKPRSPELKSGIPNCGQICFLNSVLQTLRKMPHILDLLNRETEAPSDEDPTRKGYRVLANHVKGTILKLFTVLNSPLLSRSADIAYRSNLQGQIVSGFHAYLAWHQCVVSGKSSLHLDDQQHDAREVFRILTDIIGLNDGPQFRLKSRYFLPADRTLRLSSSDDSDTYLELPIVDSKVTNVQEAIAAISNSEKIRGLKFDDFQKGTVAVKETFFTLTQNGAVPDHIGFSLLREVWNPRAERVDSLQKAIELTPQIEIKYKLVSDLLNEQAPLYRARFRLSSVMLRTGETGTSGHYKAAYYNPEEKIWYLYNDSDVSSISDYEMAYFIRDMEEQAVSLHYIKVDDETNQDQTRTESPVQTKALGGPGITKPQERIIETAASK